MKRKRWTQQYFDSHFKIDNNNYIDRWGFSWRASQKTRLNISFNIMKPFLHNKNKILEIGCASGDFTLKIINYLKSFDIVGIDTSIKAIDVCNKRFYENINNSKLLFEVGKLPKLKYSDNMFDFIICTEVLSYFKNSQKLICLKEIKRVLSNHGFVLFSTNLSNNNGESAKEFLKLLDKNFKIIKVEYVYNQLYYKLIENRFFSFCDKYYISNLHLSNDTFLIDKFLYFIGKVLYKLLSSVKIITFFELINKTLYKNGVTHVIALVSI